MHAFFSTKIDRLPSAVRPASGKKYVQASWFLV